MVGLVGESFACAFLGLRPCGRRGLDPPAYGALAQLVERLLCKQDVIGSNPLGSTNSRRHDQTAPFGSVSSCRTPASFGEAF